MTAIDDGIYEVGLPLKGGLTNQEFGINVPKAISPANLLGSLDRQSRGSP